MSRADFEMLVSFAVPGQKSVAVDVHRLRVIQPEDLRQKKAIYIPGHVRCIAVNVANRFLNRRATLFLVAGEIELLLSDNLAHPAVITGKDFKIITG